MSTFLYKLNSPQFALGLLAMIAMVVTYWVITLPQGAAKTFAACYATVEGFYVVPRHPQETGESWQDYYAKEEAHFNSVEVCVNALEPLDKLSKQLCKLPGLAIGCETAAKIGNPNHTTATQGE